MEKLAIGKTFNVVEVLDNIGFMELKGKQGIFEDCFFKTFVHNNSPGAIMFDDETKPIGKLTITKLKC